jgi:rod shape-determining protein MreD
MSVFRQVVIIVLLLAIQAAIGRLVSIGPIQPNFLTIYVIYFLLRRGVRDGIWLGFAVGIVQDLVTTQFIGISCLSYGITCFVIGKLSTFWSGDTRATWLGWLLAGTILHGLIYFFFYATGTSLSFGRLLLNFALPTALVTTLFGALWSVTPWWRSSFRRG